MTAATPRMMSERRFSRVVLTMVALGFLALIVAAGAAGWTVLESQTHTRWVEHTYRVHQRISELRTAIEQEEAARRGYLLSRTRERRRLFARAQAPIPALAEAIGTLTQDNPRQQNAVRMLKAMLGRHGTLLDASMRLADRDPAAAARNFESDGSLQAVRGIRRLTLAMMGEEDRLLAQRMAKQHQSVVQLFTLLLVSGVLLVIVAVFSLIVLRRYTRGLVQARETVESLNEELEDRVEERTLDLRRANDEIQRFAYIVSHDLRSPLVNVMGFTGELEAATKPLAALVDAVEAEAPQLLSNDAVLAAREDLPESIRFIRTSTQKMDRLINAILRLSREGKRVLAPEPLDLAQIGEGVVQSLQHRLDEIGAEIIVRRPMPAITADRLAVEQMLSNLVENAVKYLKPGRPGRIEIAARAVRDRVAIDVADNGRGIDPRDHDRIFDLFRRSGTQDQPGEGIGLAHVRALAYRLGGLIECHSTLGEGATFTLTLPATPLANQG